MKKLMVILGLLIVLMVASVSADLVITDYEPSSLVNIDFGESQLFTINATYNESEDTIIDVIWNIGLFFLPEESSILGNGNLYSSATVSWDDYSLYFENEFFGFYDGLTNVTYTISLTNGTVITQYYPVQFEIVPTCTETNSPCGGGCPITNFYRYFDRYNFTEDIDAVGDITGWDTSCVTNMERMFFDSDFNQDISNWDTSNVTNMAIMFERASEFNQDITGWDTSSVTDMSRMFRLATNFNQDLSSWCVSLITEEPVAFAENSALESSNYPVWGTCPETIVEDEETTTVIEGVGSGWVRRPNLLTGAVTGEPIVDEGVVEDVGLWERFVAWLKGLFGK